MPLFVFSRVPFRGWLVKPKAKLPVWALPDFDIPHLVTGARKELSLTRGRRICDCQQLRARHSQHVRSSGLANKKSKRFFSSPSHQHRLPINCKNPGAQEVRFCHSFRSWLLPVKAPQPDRETAMLGGSTSRSTRILP